MNYELIDKIVKSTNNGTLYDVNYKVTSPIDKETLDFLKSVELVVSEDNHVKSELEYAEDYNHSEIFKRIQEAGSTVWGRMKSLKKYKEGHVVDEEKSVKWNREGVNKHNADVDAKKKILKELYYLITRSGERAILGDDYDSDYHKCVYNKAYEEGHYAGYGEVYSYYCDLLEWANNLKKYGIKI